MLQEAGHHLDEEELQPDEERGIGLIPLAIAKYIATYFAGHTGGGRGQLGWRCKRIRWK